MIRSKWTLLLCLVSWNIFLLVVVIHRFNLILVHVVYLFNFFRTTLQRHIFGTKLAYYRRQNVLLYYAQYSHAKIKCSRTSSNNVKKNNIECLREFNFLI